MAEDTTTTTTTDESETDESEEQEPEQDKGTETKQPEIPPAVAAALKKANGEAEKYRLKLKAIEDRDKSEIQRATEERDEAKKEADKARSDYLRLKVGTAKGLPVSLASRLQGDTEDELEADADALLAAMKPAANGKGPSFEAGARKPAPKKQDMNDLIRGRSRR